MKLLPVFSAAFLLSLSSLASAQIQRCVDNDGRVTFTDNVCPKSTAKGTSVKAGQKNVGSGSDGGSDTNWAAKNEAFNQRQAVRDRNDLLDNTRRSNERAVKDFMSTPLPEGVRSARLTTYTDKPHKLENKKYDQ
ncbi:DUF4124 domain-containing protein [Undibacterium sp. JH2W]|uniref:DUF4124 domain-containing protein n=1 Tax=Undibacterium sp. JH2W TaxID=3413037 RepID=UPI003BF102F2